MPGSHELTRHHALPRRYLGRDILSGREGRGYTALDLFKFFGLIAALIFALAWTYVRYLDLFAEAMKPDAEPLMVTWAYLTIIPLLLALLALEGFFWWASRALVDYTRWQRVLPTAWRWFWMLVLNFYFIIVLDPLDQIHRLMSRNGMAPAPNLILLFSGEFELFQFQWGYFLLWLLFWFLIVAAHLSYIADGLRETWFYIRRINRYSASVLMGFRATAAVALSPPATLRDLPAPTVSIPRLLIDSLTAEQAAAIVAADASRSIRLAPGQRSALLVDLGSFHWSSELASLRDDAGEPWLTAEQVPYSPTASREALVVPLVRVQA